MRTTAATTLLLSTFLSNQYTSVAFTVLPSTKVTTKLPTRVTARVKVAIGGRPSTTNLYAGGFEWEDPAEEFDQGVDNPFENPELTLLTGAEIQKNWDAKKDASGDDGEKEGEVGKENAGVDPARLLGPRLSGSNLYFVGMMGSGKSAVGDVVAQRMGNYNFLDTDNIIEKATQLTIPEIFESEGEEAFREVEAQILDSVHAYVRCVISTGGGIVTRMQNWSKLQTGIVVYLDVDPTIIIERLKASDGTENRPLLQTENPLDTLQSLLKERKTKYEQADIAIEVTADMDEQKVADEVFKSIHYFIDENPPAWKKAKAKAQSEGLDWVQ